MVLITNCDSPRLAWHSSAGSGAKVRVSCLAWEKVVIIDSDGTLAFYDTATKTKEEAHTHDAIKARTMRTLAVSSKLDV